MSKYWKQIEEKVFKDWADASAKVNIWQKEGETVVFTNGCFDLLHLGHLKYLSEASDLGQKLIVGLNSDQSVQLLKGPNRPIHSENERAILLASLDFVDGVVIFKQETPKDLIQTLLPDILVKGGDYTLDTIIGAQDIIDNGGEVKTLSFLEGYSSSAIIQKIKEL